MRPPACTQCKWGSGTTCEKPSTSSSSKEIKGKLEEMMAERSRQDIAWFAPPGNTEIKKTSEIETQTYGSNKTQ